MNLTETKQLCRLVNCLCPAQRFDQFSPEAWLLTLQHVSYADAKLAVSELAALDLEPGKARYIEPGHIVAQVKRIHRRRLDQAGSIDPPPDLDDRAYLAWLRRSRAQIAAGEASPTVELSANSEGQRRLAEITATTTRKVDAA